MLLAKLAGGALRLAAKGAHTGGVLAPSFYLTKLTLIHHAQSLTFRGPCLCVHVCLLHSYWLDEKRGLVTEHLTCASLSRIIFNMDEKKSLISQAVRGIQAPRPCQDDNYIFKKGLRSGRKLIIC